MDPRELVFYTSTVAKRRQARVACRLSSLGGAHATPGVQHGRRPSGGGRDAPVAPLATTPDA